MSKICIGTSGWYYEHWNEIFYPPDIKSDERLKFYAQHFDTVEINNTFYHLPKAKTILDWYSKVPQGFIFSIKASSYITHLKRLHDCEETLSVFFDRMAPLKKKLGPILFQLPPSFKANLNLLKEFISHLKKGYLYTFEFRHPSWFTEETYKLLKNYKIALCITDLKGTLTPEEITAKFIYIRLHGPKSAYRGEYGTKKLMEWKSKIDNWKAQGLSVYCYFDNDEKSYAVKDAKELNRLINLK